MDDTLALLSPDFPRQPLTTLNDDVRLLGSDIFFIQFMSAHPIIRYLRYLEYEAQLLISPLAKC